MRTRAQATRDAALMRLRRVNRSLTIAAVVGTGVIVDVVAQTPLGHASARTVATTGATTTTPPSTTKKSGSSTHASTRAKHRTVSPAVNSPAVTTPAVTTPAVTTPAVVTPAATPTVISGGS